MASDANTSTAEEELARLRLKLADAQDSDIRDALAHRIEQLTKASQKSPEPEPVPDEAEVAALTAQDRERSEKLLREYRVLKMRGQQDQASALLKQAVEQTPNLPAVLEAQADDFVERGQAAKARPLYKRAHKLDPENIALERKFAETVLKTSATMSIEDQLRAGLSDSPLLTKADGVASRKAAQWLNLLVPGVGQLVLGQTTAGFSILGTWVVCTILTLLAADDLKQTLRFLGGGHGKPTLIALIPLVLGVIVYIVSIAMLGGKTEVKSRSKIDHPRPPVDLPFD